MHTVIKRIERLEASSGPGLRPVIVMIPEIDDERRRVTGYRLGRTLDCPIIHRHDDEAMEEFEARVTAPYAADHMIIMRSIVFPDDGLPGQYA